MGLVKEVTMKWLELILFLAVFGVGSALVPKR
jgi:hypothetical protein